jgi:hypothetical protein
MIQREGEAPEAEDDVDLPAVVFWWALYAIVVSAFVIHLAAG